MRNIVESHIKAIARQHGKRVGRDYLEALAKHVEEAVTVACQTRNGTKKTLDAWIAGYTLKKVA